MKKLFFLFIVVAFVSCQSGSNKSNSNESATKDVEVVEATINISGMHCDNCVASVKKGINTVEGIASVAVSLNDSNAIVKFDATKTDIKVIEEAIEKRGYTIRN